MVLMDLAALSAGHCAVAGHLMRGLTEHGRVAAPAAAAVILAKAREQVSRIVSRQASALDERVVAAAATESMLENGADAVFASLFWFLIGGIPGVVLHRMVNTLDAMWGYRSSRFLYFGRPLRDWTIFWVGCQLRLTALTYALPGERTLAIQCWRTQAPQWDSPNAGPCDGCRCRCVKCSAGWAVALCRWHRQRPTLGGTLCTTPPALKRPLDWCNTALGCGWGSSLQ